MIKTTRRVLVLNADYQALSTTGWKDAMTSVMKNLEDMKKGYIPIDYYSEKIQTTGNRKYPLPAVVRLAEYRHAKRKRISFSRKNVFMRDKMTCQYCGYKDKTGSTLTYDHVIPRARWAKMGYSGTPTSWTNIVTACRRCNLLKGERLLNETDMTLISGDMPKEPNAHNFVLGIGPWTYIPDEWKLYLPPLYKELWEKNGV